MVEAGGGGVLRFGRDGSHEIRRQGENPDNPLIVMQREMRPGERLLWADRPVSLRPHAMQHIVTGLFGIPFLAFALFWTAMASGMLLGPSGGTGTAFDYLFPMFGLPFILVGIGLVLSPFWGMWKGRQSIYALSDQRVIVLQGGRSRSVQSWSLEDIAEITRKERDGSGDVIFSRSWVPNTKGGGYWRMHGFLGVDDAASVEHALIAARDALNAKRKSLES